MKINAQNTSESLCINDINPGEAFWSGGFLFIKIHSILTMDMTGICINAVCLNDGKCHLFNKNIKVVPANVVVENNEAKITLLPKRQINND